MTEEPESSTPLPTKKGKSLRVKGSSKSSKKAPANSLSPSTTSVEGAGTQSPTGRIETLKAAKKKLANCGRANTPEPQNTIEQAISEISSILSPILEGVPARKTKERVSRVNLFGESE